MKDIDYILKKLNSGAKRKGRIKTPEDLLNSYCEKLQERRERWDELVEHGCSDPCWSDGMNMHLVRNHILYYKTNIRELCLACGLELPECYFYPAPPEVDRNYMAIENSTDEFHIKRIQRLKDRGEILSFEKPSIPLTAQFEFVS